MTDFSEYDGRGIDAVTEQANDVSDVPEVTKEATVECMHSGCSRVLIVNVELTHADGGVEVLEPSKSVYCVTHGAERYCR